MAKMALPFNAYTLENLTSGALTEKELRREYTSLRSAAEKRVKRAEAAGVQLKGIEQYKSKHVPKLSDVAPGDIETIARGLVDLRNLMYHPSGSIKQEQKTQDLVISGMREHGYDFINKHNISEFGEFMESQRKKYGKEFDSERAVMVFASVQRLITTKEERRDILENRFEEWLENIDELDALPKERNAQNRNMDYYMGRVQAKQDNVTESGQYMMEGFTRETAGKGKRKRKSNKRK